jgi:hypothetical protein
MALLAQQHAFLSSEHKHAKKTKQQQKEKKRLRYLVEKLTHLKRFDVYIIIINDDDDDDDDNATTTTTTKLDVKLAASHALVNDGALRIPLEPNFAPQQARLTRAHKDHALLKVPFARTPLPIHRDTTEYPTVLELDVTHTHTLRCRRCGAQLHAKRATAIFPRPSPYWAELADLWYCHNKNVAVVTNTAAIGAKPGVWLMGTVDVGRERAELPQRG